MWCCSIFFVINCIVFVWYREVLERVGNCNDDIVVLGDGCVVYFVVVSIEEFSDWGCDYVVSSVNIGS